MSIDQPRGIDLDAARWAQAQWGNCLLGDRRRIARAAAMGAAMAAHPDWSLPRQMGSRAATKAAYLLLNNPTLHAADLWQPHFEATREAAQWDGLTLMIQDRTGVDYTAHAAKQKVGPIGSRRQRGVLLHSTLAVAAETGQVLGLAHAQVIVRSDEPRPKRGHAQRARGPESWAWEEAVEAIGPVPAGAKWLYVSDRESDVYDYLVACRDAGAGFVVRAFHDRLIQWGPDGGERGKLMAHVRGWAPHEGYRYTVTVPATARTPAREATLVVSWGQVLFPPATCARGAKDRTPLTVWVVRAWEPDPPPGVERVEWILLTSEPVTDLAQATQVVAWYTRRWLIEDFHMCLKTGCHVEKSQLDSGDDIERLLGFHAPVAVRLLQLRQDVRVAPDRPAEEVVDPLLVQLLAAKQHRLGTMTLAQFWQGVAQLGGHQGRKSDGAPGWRTLWRGWLTLQDYAVGARLVFTGSQTPDSPH